MTSSEGLIARETAQKIKNRTTDSASPYCTFAAVKIGCGAAFVIPVSGNCEIADFQKCCEHRASDALNALSSINSFVHKSFGAVIL